MTHTRIAKAAAALILVSATGIAAAAGSTTLAVGASVKATCTFSATSTPLAFGMIDPSSTGPITASANVLYKCTNGTPSAGVTATGGNTRTMTEAGGKTLPYTLSFSGGTQTGAGFGSGKDLTLAVTGTVAQTDYQNATASNTYAENVTLNITP